MDVVLCIVSGYCVLVGTAGGQGGGAFGIVWIGGRVFLSVWDVVIQCMKLVSADTHHCPIKPST